VQAPFGAEVIRVNPTSVRFTLENTVAKRIPVIPGTLGQPEYGYEVARVSVAPDAVEIEGPESRVSVVSSISSVPIPLDGKRSSFEQPADLDLPDPQIRLKHPSPVNVKVDIRQTR
jgi:YbbR domain-containing protein